MRYYLISEDKKVVDRPQIINWFKKINAEKLKWGTYHEVAERTVLFVKENKNVYFPDIMTFPFLMVSKKVKDVLDLYEPNMGYREIILIEKKHEQMMQYFIPHLMRLECLSENARYNFNHSEVEKVVVKKEKLIDKCMFELENVSNRHVIVRHDFLESILRREVMIDFKEIEVEGNL